MKKWAYDLLDTAFYAFLWAVVIAWPAFVVRNVGWRALPVVGLPLLCAYMLGAERGYQRWRLLRERGDLPSDVVVRFRYRFGIVGDPMITLVGDAANTPNAGDVYLDWSFDPLPNVSALPVRKKE